MITDFFYLLPNVFAHRGRALLYFKSPTTANGAVSGATHFCLDCLDEALRISQPLIFNTDQGAQFTSLAFTGHLVQAGIRISMDGRGRTHDNIFAERLGRSVKYEEVDPNGYDTPDDAYRGLYRYFEFDNHQRPHQALGYRTRVEVYADRTVILSPRDAEALP